MLSSSVAKGRGVPGAQLPGRDLGPVNKPGSYLLSACLSFPTYTPGILLGSV